MIAEAIKALRQNHALEHATISLLTRKTGLNTRLMGQSTFGGFYIFGQVSSEAVAEAATEALSRLQKGERRMAISPFCGTNYVVAGILSAVTAMAILGRRDWAKRFPSAVAGAVLAVAIAQPLGALTQEHLTTSTDVANVRIKRIITSGSGRTLRHKVETQRTLEEVDID